MKCIDCGAENPKEFFGTIGEGIRCRPCHQTKQMTRTKTRFKPAINCKQCDGTGYASIPPHAGGRCACTTDGKPART